MEVKDACLKPASSSDTNKENILFSDIMSSTVTHSNSADELMDLSEESDVEKSESLDFSTIPASQDSSTLVSDNCDSDVPLREEKKVVACSDAPSKIQNPLTFSEPEDGELAFETEEILYPDNRIENWEPVRVSAEKLAERAKRFGLNSSSAPIAKEELLKLYQSLDIPLNLVRSGKLKNIRLNTLHMRGVQEMNTDDVIKYFDNYQPMSIEWVNDFSCNITFASDLAAAKAIKDLSSEIISTGAKETKDSLSADNDDSDTEKIVAASSEDWKNVEADDDAMGSSSVSSLFEMPVPPGKWRKGRSREKAKSTVLRFATKDDRKVRGSERRSLFYRKYGNPNYGGLKGFISNSRKRRYDSSYRNDGDDNLRNWNSPENSRNSSDISGESETRNVEHRDVHHSPAQHHDLFTSPLYRTKPEFSSDSDDANVVSAGGKKIRMHMYADDVERSRQKTSKSRPVVNRKPVREARTSAFSDDSSDERSHRQSNRRKDLPSRYKIWNPIAENMARECEIEEQSQVYRSSRYPSAHAENDLRSKLRVTSGQRPHRHVTKSADVDLRCKLQFKRRSGQVVHRSPLLISVRNRQTQSDSDSSF